MEFFVCYHYYEYASGLRPLLRRKNWSNSRKQWMCVCVCGEMVKNWSVIIIAFYDHWSQRTLALYKIVRGRNQMFSCCNVARARQWMWSIWLALHRHFLVVARMLYLQIVIAVLSDLSWLPVVCFVIFSSLTYVVHCSIHWGFSLEIVIAHDFVQHYFYEIL